MPLACVGHRRRYATVVKQRRVGAEAFFSDEFLGVQATVGLPELRVPLVRNLAHLPVEGHQKLPRFSCSRSMASNNALKLPLPNPSEPCRSISSKNTVGRSPMGLVKICNR